MEAAPPSYKKATLTDPWDLIAEYIPSDDLCSAVLVCRAWHANFMPYLWGNPASHFGTGDDRVYGEQIYVGNRATLIELGHSRPDQVYENLTMRSTLSSVPNSYATSTASSC